MYRFFIFCSYCGTDRESLILYTYGRYAGGNWYTAGTTGPGVLIKYTGENAASYLKDELYKMNAKAFEIKDANQNKVQQYMDNLYNGSSKKPESDNKIINENGRVVNTYSLFGNNCTTTSCDALKAGGSNVFEVNGLFYNYDEDFTIPSSLQNYLSDQSKKNGNIVDVTKQMKTEFPNVEGKSILKSAGSSGTSSGSSADFSGSSANSSSTDFSSSGNGSGSLGSGSGSSSSHDFDKK